MDHLPRISKPQIDLPKVPWLMENDPLKSKDLSKENQGRIGPLFNDENVNDRQTSAFFQANVYYHTLAAFMAVHYIGVQPEDFFVDTGSEKLLTTRYLWDYLAAWIVKASRQSYFVLEGRLEVHIRRSEFAQRNKAKDDFKQAYTIVQKACLLLRFFMTYRHRIFANVWDSTLVLLSTLENTILRAYRSTDIVRDRSRDVSLLFSIPSSLMAEMFEKQGWCPNEQHAVMTRFESDPSVLLCCVQLDRHQSDVNHTRCTIRECNAYQVDKKTYVTEHVIKGCTCSFLDAGNVYQDPMYRQRSFKITKLVEKVPAIVYKEGMLQVVPVVPLEAEVGTLVRGFHKSTSTRANFVAISHIWAQGRGNPRSNALPTCQIEHLQVYLSIVCLCDEADLTQSLANRLYPDTTDPVPFWIDTLCIPLEPEARKIGIQSMERVYKTAPKILVLDEALLRIESKSLSAEEIALQIACSVWSGRLWTLQESLYQKRVFYRFADAVQNFPFLNDTVRQLHAFPSRPRGVPQGHFLHKMLDDAPNLENPKSPLRRNAHKALSLWPKIAIFFKQIDISNSWQAGQTNESLSDVFRSMMTRTTSRVEDESLVFVSANSRLAGSVKHLLEAKPDERYRVVFRPRHGYSDVMGHLIFLDQRRYAEDGSRWIPRSLLSQSMASDSIAYVPRGAEDGIAWATGGISVRYPGVVIEKCGEDNDGRSLPHEFTMNVQSSKESPLELYACSVFEAGTQNTVRSTIQHPAIILPRVMMTYLRNYIGVLVDIVNWDEVEQEGKRGGSSSSTTDALNTATLTDADADGLLLLTLPNANSPRQYGKYFHFHVRARHEALIRMNPISGWGHREPYASLPKLQVRNLLVEPKVGEEFRSPADGLPRWLVL